MKKDYEELTRIMEGCSDLELLSYRALIALGVIAFEDAETGERHIKNDLEVFDCLTFELVYRGVL
jgi:hypothetical protein